ncbi:MAG: hypothetical protein ABH859_03325 [Pseudomonadota bacterium]
MKKLIFSIFATFFLIALMITEVAAQGFQIMIIDKDTGQGISSATVDIELGTRPKLGDISARTYDYEKIATLWTLDGYLNGVTTIPIDLDEVAEEYISVRLKISAPGYKTIFKKWNNLNNNFINTEPAPTLEIGLEKIPKIRVFQRLLDE